MQDRSCPALLVSAPASGQGKTTVTAALARHARRSGRRVRVFKTGPDFLDPTILERASGAPVYALDLWMGGRAHCAALLHAAAGHCDLILVEGAMGLHDGTPSSAELAHRFGIPVLAVIDAGAMAQTFGALALGLARYRPDLALYGVLANRVGGTAHAAMLAQSLPPGVRWHGALGFDPALGLAERHLGLHPAGEIADLDARIDAAAAALGRHADLDGLTPVRFAAEPPVRPEPPAALAGLRIAVARDEALGFLYPANLDLLRELGAELRFFSLLHDAAPPPADALYLPGGYPELHAVRLAANTAMHQALRRHHAEGKPLLAECGGMMTLAQTLVDGAGRSHAMAGLLPGTVRMQPALQALALQSVNLGHGELRGHAFHYSHFDTPLATYSRGRTQHGGAGAVVYRQGRLTASYLHLYLPSNPAAAARLFLP